MIIEESNAFIRAVKKLHPNQRTCLDEAVEAIKDNPFIGEDKVGNLTGILVYKFKMVNQLMLLAYTYNNETVTLWFLYLGPHENFYRDLKKTLKNL